MQGRIGLLLAGAALAIGGGITGAVVVAPTLVDEQASVAEFSQAGKQTRATPQHTFKVAKKARGMARGARQLINGALPKIDQAQLTANQALSQAGQALEAAGVANSRLDATKFVTETVPGPASVSSDTYVRDPASVGPTVQVTVPESGRIEVFASALFENSGAIGLYEDGNLVPMQQDGVCTGGSPAPDDALISELSGLTPPPLYLSTGGLSFFGICGNIGDAGSTILLKRPPGTHTYELRYADCGCGPTFDLSNRTLSIAARP